MEEPYTETLDSVFTRLNLYSIDLLELLRNPKQKSASFLPEMADLLRRTPPEALQSCFDYTLFPLLLLLDAAVECRKEKKVDSGESLGALEISDRVAEGVLMCIEALLNKCHLGSVDQMVMLLKKLPYGAMLSPLEASEEFRGGIIRCLRAMLLRLQQCSVGSCSCKQTILLPTMIPITSLEVDYKTSMSNLAEPKECLLAFLQSQNASAAVGHWLSLLLQAAEVEASRGHRGSANLRREAFLTLRVLVAKVGSADALAFFLPGIVSRFARTLHVSKNMISGPAGSTLSIEHAVLGLTEFLMIVLNDKENLCEPQVSGNETTGFCPSDSNSTESVLALLRDLPINMQNQTTNIINPLVKDGDKGKSNNYHSDARSLHVQRTKEWIDETVKNVDKLLSATFPHLCVHPADKARKALVDGMRGLLFNCSYTLKRSKLLLLDCLCLLVCDDAVIVSEAAKESLESLFMQGRSLITEQEISEIFTRLIEKLPRVVLGSEETVALSHARRLLVLIYYAGPELVINHFLRSPVNAACIVECLALSLSPNSQFSGSVDKLISSKPLSVGYLFSIAELKAGAHLKDLSHGFDSFPSLASKISVIQDNDLHNPMHVHSSDYELPHIPPWFVHVGSQKLYLALAGIVRLIGLSTVAGQKPCVSLSVLVDILLDHLRKLISDLRTTDFSKDGWRAWYFQRGSGQLMRQTSAAVCMLNEIIYGLSDQSINLYLRLFSRAEETVETSCSVVWRILYENGTKDQIIHSIGSILHEYLSTEVWELPVDQHSPVLENETDNLPLHFFRDTTMLHQVIIDGIGICGILLGKDFERSGFMHSSLYMLLQKLISSSIPIRIASDAVLKVLAAASGSVTVAQLVVANADYIVDSMCRQLRHLDLNPHVPDVLASMLSYIGAAQDILPLLEEPMRAVSLELEVLGRHEHPHLTVSFLKAVGEITKASKCEACRLPDEAQSFYAEVNSQVHIIQTMVKMNQNGNSVLSENLELNPKSDYLSLEYWEDSLCKMNEMRRYRRIVGSLAGSCLTAATPLLSSLKGPACLVALDIVENAVISIAKVEEAYKHEKQTKAAIEKAIHLLSFNDLEDAMDAADEDVDENRLLPAMNKIWPYFIICLKNKISVSVVKKCTSVLSIAIKISGGDFFVRRFHNDGPVIWKLLTVSPFRRKPLQSKDERAIVLPYRANSPSTEEPMAEISHQKIQASVLEMIAEISSNKRSATALESVLKKVSGLVVGIACNSTTGLLREAALKALEGLSSIDPDLIWLLLADVYYSLNKKETSAPPCNDLSGISQLLPPPLSSKEYLYVLYGGESFGHDIDPLAVEMAFKRIDTEISV
ncbi:uncharacterized protein LOC109713762 isoform X2 [Ananas comosus]|uniref:Uncharacterized protein LOC109713762 isoform X2 n=1 Tax=Ananas comosus TaxID=4615 RepID=A0A6P5FBD8_ANACO|nr:uncharacterized protein LOC109713762 isoform X2 [Ananas comosus]